MVRSNWALLRITIGTQHLRSLIFSSVVCIALTGCCAFVPCHPATSVVGTVRDANGRPVAHATVTLYCTTISTDSKGCFSLHAPDALPFTFTVAAADYKSAPVEAKAGFYRVSASLAPTQSQDQSQVEWVSIPPNEYDSSTPCGS